MAQNDQNPPDWLPPTRYSQIQVRDDPDLLDAFITQIAEQTRIPAIQVEKDFWMTEILRGAAHWSAESACSVVWKGGTSLSKAFGIVKRFSEDVDLIVAVPSQTKNNDERNLKDLVGACETATGLLGVVIPQETTRGIKRSARFAFTTNNSYGGESEGVLLQVGTRGGAFPSVQHRVRSLVSEHHRTVDVAADFKEWDDVPMLVLDPLRTLVEKLVILHHAATEGDDNRKLVTARHYYDVHCLLSDAQLVARLRETPVDLMAREIATHSRAMNLPVVTRPKGGFARSPAFAAMGNPTARVHYSDVVLQRFVWPGTPKPTFDECCRIVVESGPLL